MSTTSQLQAAAKALATTDAKRAVQVARRDALIVQALTEGATWAAVQDLAGLNPSAVAKAVRRHSGRASDPQHGSP